MARASVLSPTPVNQCGTLAHVSGLDIVQDHHISLSSVRYGSITFIYLFILQFYNLACNLDLSILLKRTSLSG